MKFKKGDIVRLSKDFTDSKYFRDFYHEHKGWHKDARYRVMGQTPNNNGLVLITHVDPNLKFSPTLCTAFINIGKNVTDVQEDNLELDRSYYGVKLKR